MSRFENYDFDRYDDFDDNKVSVSDCYCRTMMLCSNCMKGYK